MRSDPDFGPLSDIAENIALARAFQQGMSFDQFRADTKAIYAVTRALEIISEASRRISQAVKQRHPNIGWARMAGAGNIYRHDYLDIREDVLWRTVHEFLPPLATVVEEEIRRMETEK
jgi:uncharacterized protein with HEPN domain